MSGDEPSALPSRMLRLIRYGPDLRERGDAAVDDALVRTAMSARRHGWSWAQWAGLVTERCCSELGNMAARDSKGKPVDLDKRLRRAWERATKRTASPKITSEDVIGKIEIVREWIVAGCPQPRGCYALSAEERAILLCACDRAERLGTTKPAMPERAVANETGLGRSPVRRTLARLDRRGLLRLVERGWPTKPGSGGTPRANAHSLPVRLATVLRTTAPVHAVPTPVHGDLKEAARAAIPMHDDHEKEEDMAEVILTVRGATLERVLEALERGGLTASAEPPAEPLAELPENVTPIRRPGAES